VAATLDQTEERLRHDAPGGGAADHARQQALDQASGPPILQRGEDCGQARGQRLGRRADRRGIGEETAQQAGEIGPHQHAGHLGLGDHMRADEPPERPAEAGLLRRDDRGMGNGNAERMAEQRGDSEPIREASDHARLGGGFQQVPPQAGRQRETARTERGHEDEKAAGEKTMAAERAAIRRIRVLPHRGGHCIHAAVTARA
jgi:hypothetical protein